MIDDPSAVAFDRPSALALVSLPDPLEVALLLKRWGSMAQLLQGRLSLFSLQHELLIQSAWTNVSIEN